MVQRGDRAPDFTLPADDGSEVSLSDFRGRTLVLYFYPRDDTPGCTRQACDLRDGMPRLRTLDAAVVGVSPDSPASHRRFKAKFDLNFPLLADEDHTVAEAYGVWKEKSMFGRRYHGIERSTFLIDGEGRVAEAWRGVNAKEHAELVTSRLEADP
ncbi:MAG TPA: thioredoxin-dependent thiol peroxidase [Longimicrobiales bacterium]|nr:thioredoxin-dependent thiol peroxidase [Longimicrobiales bacterium]